MFSSFKNATSADSFIVPSTNFNPFADDAVTSNINPAISALLNPGIIDRLVHEDPKVKTVIS